MKERGKKNRAPGTLFFMATDNTNSVLVSWSVCQTTIICVPANTPVSSKTSLSAVCATK